MQGECGKLPWYEQSYARLLIDNHISEASPELLSRFDPAAYVRLVKAGGIDAAMVYATCHNGNCYFPTQAGHMHANLHGRDIFGETVRLLRQEGITPIAYYTWIYHNHAAKTHPQWRMTGPGGKQHDGRYWYACPNHPEYMAFAKREAAEVAAYDVAGMFIDMTFWPLVCLCGSCRQRYLNETGQEIPATIDWNDPAWVRFQRARERWLAGFAQEMTDHLKAQKPGLTVVHQFSPVLAGWHLGQSPGIAAASDYASGDFYGSKFQQRLGVKAMAAFTSKMPYEFMTSRCVNLYDHTSTKSDDELYCSAATTLANGGACFFIDAINPDGTLVESFYKRLGAINERLKPFQRKLAQLRPKLLADTGLYFSMPSFVNENLGGIDLTAASQFTSNMNPMTNIRNIQELIGASVILNRLHRPYTIVTEKAADWSGYHTLIVNNALFMAAGEAQRIRQFVADGGTLIATGLTSYYDADGGTTGDFALADVLGVTYSGSMSGKVSYLAGWPGQPYILCDAPAPLVRATSAQVLARVALCAFEPYDPEHYVSIHSNPPGPVTEYAGLTVHPYGKGKCLYLYSSLMAMRNDAQQRFVRELIEQQAPPSMLRACNAADPVEVTLLKSTADDSLLLGFVNYQEDLPNIPIVGLKVTLTLPPQYKVKSCTAVSDGREIPFTGGQGLLSLELPVLTTNEMIHIQG